MKRFTCCGAIVVLWLGAMHAATAWAEDPVPADHGILELDVPDGATIVLDRRNQGTKRRFTWDNLASGKSFVSQITVKFVGGGEAQRVAVISGGQRVRIAAHAPSRIVYEYSTDEIEGIYSIGPDGRSKQRLTDGYHTDPKLSPDGTQVLFQKSRGDDYIDELWVVGVDGSDAKRLAWDAEKDVGYGSWSPDGKQIVFDRWGDDENDEVKYETLIMNADGSNQRPLFRGGWSPDWSPRGDWIAYTKSGKEDESEIWLVHPDGSGSRRLVQGWSASWSPDGRQIACISDGRLLVVDLQGKQIKRFPKFSGQKPEWWEEGFHSFECYRACWSPDGKNLVYELAVEPADDFFEWPVSSLYIIGADGRGNRLLVAPPEEIWIGSGACDPSWR